MVPHPVLDDYLARWRLTPDGTPLITLTSVLLPVLQDGAPAMLKVATEAEERRGAASMIWWGGDGAARVLAHDGDALLMERATGEDSLVEMARNDRDDEASRIICAVASRLHAPRGSPALAVARAFDTSGLPSWSPLPLGMVVSSTWLQQRRASCWPNLETSSCCTGTSTTAISSTLAHGAGWRSTPSTSWVNAPLISSIFFAIRTLRSRWPPAVFRDRRQWWLTRPASIARACCKWTLAFTGLSAAWILGDGDQPDLDLAVGRACGS